MCIIPYYGMCSVTKLLDGGVPNYVMDYFSLRLCRLLLCTRYQTWPIHLPVSGFLVDPVRRPDPPPPLFYPAPVPPHTTPNHSGVIRPPGRRPVSASIPPLELLPPISCCPVLLLLSQPPPILTPPTCSTSCPRLLYDYTTKCFSNLQQHSLFPPHRTPGLGVGAPTAPPFSASDQCTKL